MRVMHLESGNSFYGGAKQVLDLTEGLSEKKINNYLLCRPTSLIKKKYKGKKNWVNIVEMPMRGELDLFFYSNLKKILKIYKPHILHVHSRRGVDYYSGLCAKSLGIPSIITRRVDSIEIKKIARIKYNSYDAVIAISKSIQNYLINYLGIDKSIVHYIPSGVSLNRNNYNFSNNSIIKKLNLPSDINFTIGIISQLIPRKGHLEFFMLLRELIEKHPKIHVICFGDGYLRKKIEYKLNSLNLNEYVSLVGFRSDIIDQIPKLDLVVHPATREGLGLSILESLSLGVPVVAYSIGGIRDIIIDKVNGILIPPYDKLNFIDSIDRLISNPHERDYLAMNCYKSIKEEFSINKMINSNLEIYNKIIRAYS
tara:strand:+ start:57548 stop:58651 length:1104 start_codon:yes stop_codon:yes gene_type:complete